MQIHDDVHEFDVPCAAQPAFEAFALRTAEWWSAEAVGSPDTFSHVFFEPVVGGRVQEIASDGTQTFRGEVKEWKPGRRLVFTFSKAEDAVHPSTISVDFIHTGDDAATVRIHHLTGDEDRFNNWDGFVKPYAALLGVYTH